MSADFFLLIIFTVIIDSLVCNSSLGSVDRVARLNGTFPTIGDQHLVTNIRIFPMITSVTGHQQLDVAAHDSSAFGWPSAMYAMAVCGHSGIVPLGGRHTSSGYFG